MMAPSQKHDESMAAAYRHWRRVHPLLPFVTATAFGFTGALGLMALLLP